MPQCHLAIRSLVRSHDPTLRCRRTLRCATWRLKSQNYSIASATSQIDEASTIDHESAYLDFLVGDISSRDEIGDAQDRGSYPEERSGPRGIFEGVSAIRTARLATQRTAQKEDGQLQAIKWKKRLITRKDDTKVAEQPSGASVRKAEDYGPLGTKFFHFKAQRQKSIEAHQLRKKKKREVVNLARSANANLRSARQHIGPVKTKFVSIRSSRETYNAFSFDWNRQFALISSSLDKGIPRRLRRALDNANAHSNPPREVKRVLANIHDDATDPFVGISFKNSSEVLRHRLWTRVTLWLLRHRPEETLSFLKATHIQPYPPVQFVQDSLQYLGWLFSSPEHFSEEKLRAIADMLPTLAERGGQEYLQFDDSLITDLIHHLSLEEVETVYRTVKDFHIQIRWPAWLHFATYFNKRDRLEHGLDCILQAKNTGANLQHMPFLSNCSTLLRTAIKQPGGFRVCLRIVDNLVEMGVGLNTQLCNIIMLNAVESNDLKTAFDVYKSLTRHGLKPDVYTFAVLLKGCKLAIDDVERLNLIIRDAIEHVQVLKQPIIATEILHCLALHHSKHHPGSAFGTVADAYAQMFDLKALQRLGVAIPSLSQPSRPPEQRIQPGPQSVRILLAVYMDDLFLREHSTKPAHTIYRRFLALANEGVEPFTSMLREDYIFNAFLLAFIKTRKGLVHATELIKDMHRSSSDNSIPQTCAPTVRTWSIYLSGFTNHGRMKLAEQVLTYMRKQNIEPDQTVWNTLAAGYAGKQDVDGALGVLRRMEADGKVWDEFTMRGLKRARDRGRLIAEFETKKRMEKIDFTGDLKEGLAKKLAEIVDAKVVRKGAEQLDQELVADAAAVVGEGDAPFVPLCVNQSSL